MVERRSIDVLLTTEGTYPVVRGGVGTWCDMLVRGVPGVRYHVYAILAHPYLPNRYPIPNSVSVFRIPMWGTEEPTEHLDQPFSQVYERKLATTPERVHSEFLPMFNQLQTSIWNPRPDGRQFGLVLRELYRWFQEHDYLEAMKSQEVWQYFLDGLQGGRWTRESSLPTVSDATQAMGWLYRFLVVLGTPLPKVDLTHSSVAAFAGLPGVLGRLERRTPFLLTEHGVYLREQYAAIGRSSMSLFSKRFLLGLVRSVVSANYAYADLVAPVAAFNARWEKRYGVPEDRIRVIYNGVDPNTFAPRPRPEGAPLTVVSVARIDPLKDIITLLRSAALVRDQMPQVKFVVYGGVSVPAYYEQCLALREELGLTESFIFAGHVSDVPAAYASGDVVVLSSISEGFPYSVVEAMMSGRALVATDVGGTREACAGAGLLVEARQPGQMAQALLRLLGDASLRTTLAEEARERALAYFTLERNFQLYRNAYESLAAPAAARAIAVPTSELLARRLRLALDRALALQILGRNREAIGELRMAIDLDPTNPRNPALLLTIADLYLTQGDVRSSRRELERAETLSCLLKAQQAG